jgi:dCMP deaminase
MAGSHEDYSRDAAKKFATKWDLRFLKLAELVASWSKDPSTKTGAVIVRPDRSVASLGFNGFPQSMPDTPEHYANRDEKYSRIVHCEVNAQIFAREPLQGYTLYTWPFLSCDRCAVQMLQAGIKKFVAPTATEDQLTRWGAAFEKVRRYLWESGAIFYEIDRKELGLE